MATDYAEMEREFLAGLEADTGRDLAVWMALIDAQNLAHRNDIIDWLRTQRFTFAWASWLERIHHNGGQPIYTSAPAPTPAIMSPPVAAPMTVPVTPPPPPAQPVATVAEARRPAPGAAPAPQPLENAQALAALLAKAKAYRPLAEHLIREARKALPDVAVSIRDGYVSLCRPAEFAALAVSARELRLGLDLGEEVGATAMPRGRMPGTLARISHVLVLTDARQVDAALLAAVRMADRRVNGG